MLEPDGSIISSKRPDDNTYWYRQDVRGSVTNIVDGTDDVVKSYTYEAYGKTSGTGTFVNSFAYTGAVNDEETGLTYMNARYYEPETGRFISEDSYRGEGEAFWNLYLYCNGDPVDNTDKSGNTYTSLVKTIYYKYCTFKVKLYYDYYTKNYSEYGRLVKGYASVSGNARGYRNLKITCIVSGAWRNKDGKHGCYLHPKYFSTTISQPKRSYFYSKSCPDSHFFDLSNGTGVIAVKASVSANYALNKWTSYSISVEEGGLSWQL